MHFAFSDDQRLIRETARQFAAREIAPQARANEHNDRFAEQMMRRMAGIDLLGGPIPQQYGGAGIDSLSYALLCEEIGRASVSVFTSALTVQISLVAQTILGWGTEEQKQEYLPKLCSAEWIGAYALTEPNAGSDPASLETRARPDGDEWVLDGSKMWTSNGAVADVIIVFAQTEPGSGHRGIAAFLVHSDSAGFSARTIEGKLGLGASNTAQLFLDQVHVPKSRLLSPPGKGFRTAMFALDNGRLSTAACAVGISQGCLDASTQYAGQRQQFGKPIAAHQLVQELIADMATEVEAARLLVLQAADRKDRGEPFTRAVSMAKYFASEAAVRAARNAIQVHGGYGYSAEFPVEQYLRDAVALTLYEGTSQIQKLIIGREVLGTPAFA